MFNALFSLLTQNYLTRGFWGDEAWTALISQFSYADILKITGQDFHPPFYYFLVHTWGNFFGFGEMAIRSLSVIFFLITPFLVWKLVRVIFQDEYRAKWVAVLSAVLVFFSPILQTYAFEARSYALLAFLSVTSALVFWQAKNEEQGWKWRIAYFLVGAMSIYTHYYAWFILFSHGFYLLLFERDKLWKMLPPAFAVGLAQLPWLPVFLSQIGEVSSDYWIAPINNRTHWEFFVRVAGGDQSYVYQTIVAKVVLVMLAAGLVLRFLGQKMSKSYLFLITWIIVPTLIPSLISLHTPIFFYRYLIFSAIPLLILVSDALVRVPKAMMILALSSILLMYSWIGFKNFERYPYSMKQEVAKLEAEGKLTEPIYTVLPSFAEVEYYLSDYEVKVRPEGLVQFSGKSLLDAYVEKGMTQIEEPSEDSYLKIEPGPTVELISAGE